jgi:hypothetical protein
MKRARSLFCASLAAIAPAIGLCQDPAAPKSIFEKGNLAWKDVLTDNATGAITAAAMLGIKGDSVRPVENLRDLVVSLEGLGSDNERGTFGISITPARTNLAKPDLVRYHQRENYGYRLLASTTLSYAQGDTEISSIKFARRAVAVDTGLFLNPDDDPVIALNNAYAGRDSRGNAITAPTECSFPVLFPPKPPPNQPAATLPPTAPSTPAPSAPPSSANTPATAPALASTTDAKAPALAAAEEAARSKQAYNACAQKVLDGLRWNRSYLSASLATGWIKPADGGGDQRKLGRAAVVGLVYGFDHLEYLKQGAALTLAWRRTLDEPILDTLTTTDVRTKNSNLVMIRLAGGSETIRALIEASNAKGEVTPSQRAFTRALGVDFRVMKDLWLNLRVGRQRTIDGSDTEVGSLLSISYSPTALIATK